MKKNTAWPDLLKFEKKSRQKGYSLIIGVDEAGRGPLAGPVVAAAVALRDHHFQNKINDSKQLTARQREQAFLEIYAKAHIGIGIISETVIDRCNISEATYFAMTNAVWHLLGHFPMSSRKGRDITRKVFLLIDGKHFHSDMPFSYQTIIRGDALSLSIACASIVAKVTRDRILHMYHRIFPCYNFRAHKGYPTRQHRHAIKIHGPSWIHRKTYKGI